MATVEVRVLRLEDVDALRKEAGQQKEVQKGVVKYLFTVCKKKKHYLHASY